MHHFFDFHTIRSLHTPPSKVSRLRKVVLGIACAALSMLVTSSLKAYTLQSPDGNITVDVGPQSIGNHTPLAYSVTYRRTLVLEQSTLTFVTDKEQVVGNDVQLLGEAQFDSHDSTWQPVYGELSTIRDHYNQLTLSLVDKATGYQMVVTYRCYDEGIAFKTEVSGPDGQTVLHFAEERSEFRFTKNHTAWCARRAQDSYAAMKLRYLGDRVERPLTVEVNEQVVVSITEAGLVDYATMQLQRSPDDPYSVVSKLGSGVQAQDTLQTPWRVVLLGRSAGELVEHNYLILNLSAPCALEDTSWIRPGKVIREITLTTEGGKACIDFAAKNNFQYIEFDAGWYGNEYNDNSDATTITIDPKRSKGPLDLREVIDYGKQHDIGVIVYVNRRALETQLDQLLPLYQEWGIAGVKYGFVNTESQQWTSWLHEAVRKAAEHRLMVDIHDEYRPTGYSRTYPNLMTQEGVRGDEASPSSSIAITSLFTRNLAGAADHTICYFDPRVSKLWTHGHQLAKSVCTYSPWQFVYWYDTPLTAPPLKHHNLIVDSPELEFFAKVPTVWDDTKVIHGKIGQYVVTARRSGDEWFVGAMNNGKQRSLDLPLDFLIAGTRYRARVYQDAPEMESETKVDISDHTVDSATTLTLSLQPHGGQAIWLVPINTSVRASLPRSNK